ncbi:MAG: hypothetical protein BGO67_10475 [Alphaproteobacteria bacterium 41-28]|nr:MAG: hypothetical protein BGO67_10475 [Alphaproteobacteria bacterium 41-28]
MNFNRNHQSKLTPFLNSNEVHIWSACLSSAAINVSCFASFLSEDKLLRANNFKFFKDQTNFITARGILRCLLGGYLRQDPQSVEIIYDL